MKNIRTFGWVIIAINVYFFYAFFSGVDPNDGDTAIGLGFVFLIFWLAILNTFMYVLYRVTGGKKRECPACGNNVKRGLTVCPSCQFDFMKAAKGKTNDEEVAKEKTNNEEVAKEKTNDDEVQKRKQMMEKFSELNVFIQLVIVVVVLGIGLYVGSWILAPFSQSADDVNCGLDILLNLPCFYRFKG